MSPDVPLDVITTSSLRSAAALFLISSLLFRVSFSVSQRELHRINLPGPQLPNKTVQHVLSLLRHLADIQQRGTILVFS